MPRKDYQIGKNATQYFFSLHQLIFINQIKSSPCFALDAVNDQPQYANPIKITFKSLFILLYIPVDKNSIGLKI